jgi:hypothetical protein
MSKEPRERPNYYDTFILVAPDSTATEGTVPKSRGESKSVPEIEFELLSKSPYGLTQEEVLFETHIRHRGIPKSERNKSSEEFWSKSHACLRASALPKRYGWGIHFNAEGKAALVGVETDEYRRFAEGKEPGVTLVYAMRSKR